MKHRSLWLVALASAALMSMCGAASATTITSPAGAAYTGTITAGSESHILVHRSFFPTITCEAAELEWKIESHGAAVTAKGAVTRFSLKCAGLAIFPFEKGTIEVHKGLLGSPDTLTWTGAEFFFTYLPLGPNCVYRFPGGTLELGVLTSSSLTGQTATIDLDAKRFISESSSFGCSEVRMTGSFAVSTPDFLAVD